MTMTTAESSDHVTEASSSVPVAAARSNAVKSLVKRAINTWHSGSPKRMLCSNNFTRPSLAIMRPAKMTPVNGQPSAAMPSTVGLMISRMTMSVISCVTTGAGEYAPIPPVFKPVSPSPTRLWSCALASATAFPPPTTAKNEASSPSKNSSTTISFPAEPNLAPTNISSTASSASWTSMATITPLPAAKPSVFTTIGAPLDFMYAFAASTLVNFAYSAVGMLYFAHKSFINDFEPSKRAALLLGPNTGTFALTSVSAKPSTSGASGPTTTNPIAFS
mmetsp:Transcript_3933/g.8488  ORF Transcript_3933/g.8488 Transcript_3933/m.8488 type:complete len:276 (+) Transcript_3933:246-1073(+)